MLYATFKTQDWQWKTKVKDNLDFSMEPVFRRYKAKNGAKTQINGYASFLFVFQLSNNW